MNVPMLLSPKVSTAYLEYNATLRQGVEKFRAHGDSAVAVLNEDGYYMGTISEGDFLKYILNKGKLSLKDLESVRICDILRDGFNDPVNIDASIDDLIDRLMDSNFVPVVDGRGCFVGIVTRKRMLEYLRK